MNVEGDKMTITAVQARAYLHHLAIESSDPERLANFYAVAMDMDADRVSDTEWHAEGPRRRIVAVKGQDKMLSFAGFAVKNPDTLAGLKAHAKEQDVEVLECPSPYFETGAFAVRDPDGNLICFGLAKTDKAQSKGRHAPVQHLTLASTDVRAMMEFYTGKMGFQLTDTVMDEGDELKTFFSTSNHEHHTLACFQTSTQGIDHHCYEVGQWTHIRDFCDHWASKDIKIIWGPGRHGPGNNLFAFINDPDGNKIEISAELEVIHDRGAGVWPQAEKTLNLWGKGIIRT